MNINFDTYNFIKNKTDDFNNNDILFGEIELYIYNTLINKTIDKDYAQKISKEYLLSFAKELEKESDFSKIFQKIDSKVEQNIDSYLNEKNLILNRASIGNNDVIENHLINMREDVKDDFQKIFNKLIKEGIDIETAEKLALERVKNIDIIEIKEIIDFSKLSPLEAKVIFSSLSKGDNIDTAIQKSKEIVEILSKVDENIEDLSEISNSENFQSANSQISNKVLFHKLANGDDVDLSFKVAKESYENEQKIVENEKKSIANSLSAGENLENISDDKNFELFLSRALNSGFELNEALILAENFSSEMKVENNTLMSDLASGNIEQLSNILNSDTEKYFGNLLNSGVNVDSAINRTSILAKEMTPQDSNKKEIVTVKQDITVDNKSEKQVITINEVKNIVAEVKVSQTENLQKVTQTDKNSENKSVNKSAEKLVENIKEEMVSNEDIEESVEDVIINSTEEIVLALNDPTINNQTTSNNITNINHLLETQYILITQPSNPTDTTTQPSNPTDTTTQPSNPTDTTTQPSNPTDTTTQPSNPTDTTTQPSNPEPVNNPPSAIYLTKYQTTPYNTSAIFVNSLGGEFRYGANMLDTESIDIPLSLAFGNDIKYNNKIFSQTDNININKNGKVKIGDEEISIFNGDIDLTTSKGIYYGYDPLEDMFAITWLGVTENTTTTTTTENPPQMLYTNTFQMALYDISDGDGLLVDLNYQNIEWGGDTQISTNNSISWEDSSYLSINENAQNETKIAIANGEDSENNIIKFELIGDNSDIFEIVNIDNEWVLQLKNSDLLQNQGSKELELTVVATDSYNAQLSSQAIIAINDIAINRTLYENLNDNINLNFDYNHDSVIYNTLGVV